MTELEIIQENKHLREENRILKAKVFDFRIQLELILTKPSEELRAKEKMIKEIIQESPSLDAFMKHDITSTLEAEFSSHPMLQLYDNFFGLYQTEV